MLQMTEDKGDDLYDELEENLILVQTDMFVEECLEKLKKMNQMNIPMIEKGIDREIIMASRIAEI